MKKNELLQQEIDRLNKVINQKDIDIECMNGKIARLKEENSKWLFKYNELMNEVKELRKQSSDLKLENIAEMKASQMLFSIMDTGYTHREKRAFMVQANTIIEKKLSNKLYQLKFKIDKSDDPF